MRLSFSATSTSADANEEVATCSFIGELGRELGLMNEPGGLVRMSLHDGKVGIDEAVVELAAVTLWPNRALLELSPDRRHPRISYDQIEVFYENIDDCFLDFCDVFTRLCSERLMIHEAPWQSL